MIRPWLTVVWSTGLFVGAACWGDDLQNRQLLETLPRDRRSSLAENLDRFDRLGGAEQAAIRRLDATIAATEPVEQARFRSLLHHYHLWFQGLTEEQREQLLATTDLDERFTLARKLRVAEKVVPKRDGPRIARIRTGDYGLIGPYEAAYLLKIWRDLPPEKRAEIEKLPPSSLRDELKAQGKSLKLRFDRFPVDQEKLYDEKLEADPDFKPLLHLAEQVPRKADATKKAEKAQKNFEHSFAEFLYLEDHRARPVDPARLERFAESCPHWFRVLTDSLAADDARDYYATLYRLIYPGPADEMPEPVKPTKPAAADAAKKSPKSRPDSGGAAF